MQPIESLMPATLQVAAHLARTRWLLDFRDRARLEAWQKRQIHRFIRDVIPLAPRYGGAKYRTLADLPIMDKAIMMADFSANNTQGIGLEQAMEVALRAETSRDFSPTIGDLTVGLSSGTSGNRGLFLVSKEERLRWAGVILGRALPGYLLAKLLTPWQAPMSIAFFLRANSNLYTTLASRRINFEFYDLLVDMDESLVRLNKTQPNVLVAPSSVLRILSERAISGRLTIRPSRVISVAEVLEPEDSNLVKEAFGCELTHQIYQATEGMLGYTCEAGTIHLNECFLHIEPDWLDNTRTRFQPIITDFSRHTQLIVRYRLNDILHVADTPCSCGRSETAISAIEGRSDEILWLPEKVSKNPIPIYPDLLRRTMAIAGAGVLEYEIHQDGMHWEIKLLHKNDSLATVATVKRELLDFLERLSAQTPSFTFSAWQPPAPGRKRRRIYLKSSPQDISCTF